LRQAQKSTNFPHLTIYIMSVNTLITQFDALSIEDGQALNAILIPVQTEITGDGPNEPADFELSAWADAVNGLSQEDLDQLIANAGNSNPGRKVRKS